LGKIAVIFPGQGSQYIGMGLDFYQNYQVAKHIFTTADNILNDSLTKVIFTGPDDELKLTVNTQPAILLTSLAIWEVVREELGLKVDYLAGHSLGEYSALAAAGSISIAEALQLVRKRGRYMEEAVPAGEGTMAAIMGMEQDELTKLCAEVTAEGYSVELANINTPNQIVISGTKNGVEIAGERAKEQGARRVIPLSVSGPFHSRLMQPAKEQLAQAVENAAIQDARIPVVTNVTALPETSAEEIKNNLIKQVVSPVQWTNSVEWLVEAGVDTFIEVGPGKVLSGLVKKIAKDVQVFAIEDLASYSTFKEQFINKARLIRKEF